MKFIPYLIILAVSAVSLNSLFSSSLLPLMHDQVQAERVYELAKSFSFGQFPVRFVSDLGYGYGYPLFNFYAPLPYYIGALSFLLGLNLLVATKIMIGTAFVVSGISMYWLAKPYWGRAGALISATLYLLAPYHAVQLYVRGAVGELYSYALMPLVVLGLLALWSRPVSRKRIGLGIAGLAFLAMSHTLGIYLAVLLILLYLIVATITISKTKITTVYSFAFNHALFLGIPLLLSAFFLVPAFLEISATNFSLASGNKVDFHNHFVSLSQLWSSPWGFGGSAKGSDRDGLSFMIGKISVILALGVIVYSGVQKYLGLKKKIPHATLIGIGSVLAVISVILMTEWSTFFWEHVPYMSILQFPWRFLLITDLALCFLSGAIIHVFYYYLPRRIFLIASGTLLALIVFSQSKYFYKNGDYPFTAMQIRDQNHLRFEASKISDEYLPKTDLKINKDTISTDSVSCLALCLIRNVKMTPTEYQFSVVMEKSSPLFIDKLNFPQFEVTVDERKASVLSGPHNLLGVQVPEGPHTIKFTLKNSPIRLVSNAISLLAFIGIILYAQREKIWNLKQKQKS